MITLKDYQERVLESLRDFFRLTAQTTKPDAAFREVTRRFGEGAPYIPVPAAGLGADMPYVCLRVPTGGGKTLLACHAVGLAQRQFMRAERAVVLWLVPSHTILDQTADALRDPRHPYRRALELACGAVEVVTIDEALHLSRAAVDGQTVVIVSTIQSFRVEDTTGRRVYDQNGAFSEHVMNVPPDRLADLFPGADGKPKPSLVNALRLRRPIVIVDEAHNARTDLSFATLGNVLPSCIVEFTATPAREKTPSNVLHRVSAAELKTAQMVKLPLRVVTRHPSQRDQLLAEALTLRADLEKLAVLEGQQTAEYIRPILLIQAERVDACEPLRDRLVREFGLSKDEVKISVGRLDELKGVKDIASPKCQVRVIITVEKLREGWDCPFASVLCSLKETWSATAIEQIVGRILRLPDAKAKQHPDLNCAYAFSVSDSITTVLAELREALEHNGFTKAEAERIILSVPQGTLPLSVQPQTVTFAPTEIDPTLAQVQEAALAGKVRIDAAAGTITIVVPLDQDDTDRVKSCVCTPEAKAMLEVAVEAVSQAERAFGGSGKPRKPSPYEQQVDFLVPLLCFAENGMLYEFESTFLLEHPWKLSEKDASLPAAYNPLARPYGKVGVIDVGQKGDVQTTLMGDTGDADFVGTLHQQMFQFSGQDDWSVERLVAWLDREIDHHDIPVGESAEFLRKVIRGLTAKYGIADIGILALDRFRLRDEIAARIQEHREGERKASFQMLLLSDSPLTVTEARTINFKTMGYEPSRVYEGGFQFQKHYFGPKPGELTEKTAEGRVTEEFQCAQFLDGLPQVRFWVRNLVRKPTSFRLQTSKDWFYPDFLCQLKDGRTLAVEYKGRHLFDGIDAEDKRAIGAIWASRSGGRCLFVMPTEGDFSGIVGALQGQ
ncbi:DEAD/DEAH box helicase [Nitrospira defluvii]|uniref:Type III restriction enzyme, res subunit n=1 Tax=Nitrospira defluvii TaxID=330214 RepID=A0ABM8QIY3_9BACT|nr:DEAD/DEAH box helicase family protein [Nitrospira defluvii]CAE6698915.1 Putative Type III restriction enzyme, res subunit [Nitrospira defluvii]